MEEIDENGEVVIRQVRVKKHSRRIVYKSKNGKKGASRRKSSSRVGVKNGRTKSRRYQKGKKKRHGKRENGESGGSSEDYSEFSDEDDDEYNSSYESFSED